MRAVPLGFGLAAAVFLAGGGCAVVFGLDEPTVHDGTGGSDAASTSSIGAPAGPTTTAGPGAGGDAGAGGRNPSGSTGTGREPCQDDTDCDDDDPCTVDACDDETCVRTPADDGPLVDDPDDCRTIACVGGELVDEANDAEDPPDTAPPCTETICDGGAEVPRFATPGTSCGDPPLACDDRGRCAGCTPGGEEECGEPTECSSPSCTEDETCDPGFLDAGTLLTDPTSGDCQALGCTGSAVSAVVVDDDTDLPLDLPCADAGCNEGAADFTTSIEGTPCNGEPGVCDGAGNDSASCKTCRDTLATDRDPGCDTLPLPHCFEDDGLEGGGACRECTTDAHCDGNDQGEDCRPSGVCGCSIPTHCIDSARGKYCNFGTNRCTCLSDNDCNGDSASGGRCLGGGQGCGCSVAQDCEENLAGELCIGNACGCASANDCPDDSDCDPILQRCIN